MDITFFVPTLNEESHIVTVMEKINIICVTKKLEAEVIIIDDNSQDSTLELIEKFISSNTFSKISWKIVRNEKRQGLAKNYQTAYRIAQGEYFRLINGDDSEPYETLEQVMRHLWEYDVIIPFYTEILGRSMLRSVISKLFTVVTNSITGLQIHYYNGAPVYKTELIRNETLFSSGMAYSAELLYKVLSKTKNYREIGLVGVDNSSNSLHFKMYFDALCTLINIFTKERLHKRKKLQKH